MSPFPPSEKTLKKPRKTAIDVLEKFVIPERTHFLPLPTRSRPKGNPRRKIPRRVSDAQDPDEPENVTKQKNAPKKSLPALAKTCHAFAGDKDRVRFTRRGRKMSRLAEAKKRNLESPAISDISHPRISFTSQRGVTSR